MATQTTEEQEAGAETRKARVRAKAEYFVEIPIGKSDPATNKTIEGWSPAPDEFRGPHEGTAEAQRAIRKSGRAGQYRIVRVCWGGSVKNETKVVSKLT